MKIDYIQFILLFLITFMMGWVASTVYVNYSTYSDLQRPVSFSNILTPKNFEKASPYNHIQEDEIHVYNDNIIIDIKDASWSSFVDSNSMDPVIDIGANGIEIKPQKTTQVHVGDIISFRASFTNGIVIHRVVEVGIDNNGWYAITKGDNNPTVDPDKVRFEDINGIIVGVIY